MIRILHIVHALTRGGGLSNVVMNYYRNINRTKIQFDFLYFEDTDNSFTPEIEAMGGRCFKLPLPSLSWNFFRERKKFFREHCGEWQAIHCHVLFAVCFFTTVARKYGTKYVIAHSHSSTGGINIIKRMRNSIFVKQARLRSDFRFACSKNSGDFMFGKNGNYIVLNNAINTGMYKYNSQRRIRMRNDLNITDKLAITNIGGFVKSKNHSFLIDIFTSVLDKRDDAVLLLIGGDGTIAGSTRQVIVDKVDKLGIKDKVQFLGQRNDINRIVSAMDILVMPSIFEGLPVTCVEAQTSGLPCVLSDTITKEIGVYNTTYVSLKKSPAQWAEIICNIADNKKHINRENGHYAVCNAGYDIRTEARKLETFYERSLI